MHEKFRSTIEGRIQRAFDQWERTHSREDWAIFSKLHRLRCPREVERLEREKGLR